MRGKIFYFLVVVCLLVIIFVQRSCTKVVTKQTVSYDTIYKPVQLPSRVVTRYVNIAGDTVHIKGAVDTIKVREFELSTEKDSLYAEAIKIRQYRQDFKDSIADVSIFAETQGELLKLAPTITIKPRANEKKTVFAVYGGFEAMGLSNSALKANIFIQNRSGDLFTAGYDTNKNVYVGYSFRFINIRR
jgi:hypothetical protein